MNSSSTQPKNVKLYVPNAGHTAPNPTDKRPVVYTDSSAYQYNNIIYNEIPEDFGPYNETELNLSPIEFHLVDIASETHHNSIVYSSRFCTLIESFENTLATCGSNSVVVYVIEDMSMRVVMNVRDTNVDEIFFSLDWSISETGEPLICVGGESGILKVFTLISHKLLQALAGHLQPIYDVKTHPTRDGMVFSASADKSIRLWNVWTGTVVAICGGEGGHIDAVLSMDVNMAGTLMVSTGFDTYVKIWNLNEPALLETIDESYGFKAGATPFKSFEVNQVRDPAFNAFNVHMNYVDSVRFYGNDIVTKSTNNTALLWSPDSNRFRGAFAIKREFQIFGSDMWFMKIGVNVEHGLIAVPGAGGCVFLFNVLKTPLEEARNQRILRDKAETARSEGGSIDRYAPKEKYLLGAKRERFFMDQPTQPLVTLKNQRNTPYPVAREASFSSRGDLLTACFSDGAVYVWRITIKDAVDKSQSTSRSENLKSSSSSSDK